MQMRVRKRKGVEEELLARERLIENAQTVVDVLERGLRGLRIVLLGGVHSVVLRAQRDAASPAVTFAQVIHFIASPRFGPGAG